MKKHVVQMHIIPEETIELLSSWISSTLCKVAAITFPPYVVREIQGQEVQDYVLQEDCCTIALALGDLWTGFKSIVEFIQRHSNLIAYELGKVKGNVLEESSVTAITRDDDRDIESFMKRVKKMTFAGALAINENSGNSVFVRSHRFSEGAMRFEERGGKLLALGGGTIFSTRTNKSTRTDSEK